jgi:hypothetical protein
MKHSQQLQHCGSGVVVMEFMLIIASFLWIGPLCQRIQAQETKNASEVTATATQDLPSGEEVLKRHITNTGGQDAYDKIENRVSESTLEIVGQGVSVDIKTYAARPNKTLVKVDSQLTGKIEKGCDGEVVWENSLVSGPVIRDGAQRSNGLRDSTFERFVYWKKIYDSAECASVTNVGDSDCYEIVLTPKKMNGSNGDEHPMRLFIDASTYLIRKIETVVESEAGEIAVVAFPEDYRQVDGIMIAHKMRMQLLGQKRVFTVNTVKHNVDLPKNLFDLPEEVKKLVKES